MLKSLSYFIVILVTAIFYLLLISPVDPVKWGPSTNPGFNGPYAINNILSKVEKIKLPFGIGPEDIALDSNGYKYTGLRDGTIIRFKENLDFDVFANTGGKPLGMEFDKNGNLIVADAEKGIISLNKEGDLSLMTDSVNEKKMKFADDLDIANDGTIWFTDASLRYNYDDSIYSFIENRPTGRLLSFNPNLKKTNIHLEGLYFANGVAIAPNDEFVLVNETGDSSIRRYWLKGEKKGTNDYFIRGLPGYPDNISFDDNGIFWVAFAGIRNPLVDGLSNFPILRKIIGGLPKILLSPVNKHVFILGLDVEGNVIFNLHDQESDIKMLTSANLFGNKLYIGNLASNFIATIDLKNLEIKNIN